MTARVPFASLGLGAAIVAVGACLTFAGGMPSFTSTLSLPFVFLVWPLSCPVWVFPVVCVVVFLAWTFPYSERSEETKRTLYLAGLTGALSIAYFIYGYGYAIVYQTFGYFLAVSVAGVALFSLAYGVMLRARKMKHRDMRVLGSALFFCWLFWLAFPYMGELP